MGTLVKIYDCGQVYEIDSAQIYSPLFMITPPFSPNSSETVLGLKKLEQIGVIYREENEDGKEK